MHDDASSLDVPLRNIPTRLSYVIAFELNMLLMPMFLPKRTCQNNRKQLLIRDDPTLLCSVLRTCEPQIVVVYLIA